MFASAHVAALHSEPSLGHARTQRARRSRGDRKGGVAILSCLLLVFLLGLVALAVDVGMLLVARSELQRSADSAALAGTWELLNERARGSVAPMAIRNVAAAYAESNTVRLEGPTVDLNAANDPGGELVLGEAVNPFNPKSLSYGTPAKFNTTFVRLTRSVSRNGEVPLFFSRIWGINGGEVSAYAQASFLTSFRGFRVPDPGASDPPPNLMFLPIAIDEKVWKDALKGKGDDDYGWDGDKGQVTPQADGTPEVNLYPVDTGSGGNWGAVDIGSAKTGNGTLARQIENGLTKSDLTYHGDALVLDAQGELNLSGNTGISAGPLGNALEAVVGQSRIIPLFRSISGSGTNATFKIVDFVGGRVMAVKMTGKKYILLQPALIVTRGGIPADPGQQLTTQIFSPVKLTQ